MTDINKINQYEMKIGGAELGLASGSGHDAASYTGENDPMTIHAMPRKYVNIKSAKGQNAKGTGILILIGGLFIMAGLLVFLYFYLFKDDYLKFGQDIIQDANNQPLQKIITDINTKASSTNAAKDGIASSSAEGVPTASTTVIATSSADAASSSVMSADDLRSLIGTSTASSSGIDTASSAASSTAVGKLDRSAYKNGDDIDGDGLTDLEEDVIGTKASSRDSDLDGYDDKAEFSVLYNPAGAGKLIENKRIKLFNNSDYKYFIYHPSIWTTEDIGGRESVMFRVDGQQFMQVVAQENTKAQSIEEWYKEQFNAAAIDPSLEVVKKGWTGFYSPDGLKAYLLTPKKDYIFVVSYNTAGGTVLDYKGVFDMMITSLTAVN